MANVVKFNMKQVPAALSEMFVRVTDLDRNELFAGVKPISGTEIELDLGSVGAVGQGVLVQGDNFLKGSNESSFKSFSGYGIVEGIPEEILKSYDTIIGVGDSISQGEYDLAGGQYDNSYRGIKWKTGAVYGTTIQQMIDNVIDFTSQAEGKTLFIVRAGINDCNTYLSAGGVGDGAGGAVTAWVDMSQSQQDSTMTGYRELVALLKEVGDVALGTITYCDAKGQLTGLPDKGRNLHSGSWNDNTTVPLCKELTPEWYNNELDRPVFDYYTLIYNDPSVLDSDNLHFYSDRVYEATEGTGYIDGPGSYTLREETIKQVGLYTAMPSTPYDSNLYSNRILVSIGRGNGLTERPSFQRYANTLLADSTNLLHENLNSYNGTTDISMQVDYSSNGSTRNNLYTSNELWDEGAGDRNACSSGNGSNSSGKHAVEFLGLKKGTLSVVGLDSSEGGGSSYNPGAITNFEITDDNGTRIITAPSSINGTTVRIQDCIASIDFDCASTGSLHINPRPAAGSTYGNLSSICIDLQ